MTEHSLAERFEDATWHCEQPFADLNFVGTYALSELVREQGFRVLLNGVLALKSPKNYLILLYRTGKRRNIRRLFPLSAGPIA